MIDGEVVESWHRSVTGGCGDLGKGPKSAVEVRLDVVDNDVVNAIAPAILRGASIVRQAVPDLQPTGDVADSDVPDGDVGDLADGTYVSTALCLVLRAQQNGKAGLREPAPAVFEEVAFEKDTLRILELKQVLGNERTTVDAAHESRLAFHPD